MTEGCRKPASICNVLPDLERLTTPDQIAQFAESEKKAIEQRISALGLNLRLARRHDIPAIQDFQAQRFAKGTLLEDGYVLYRIIRFSYALVIENADGRIVGCNLCQAFDDPDRTLWGVRNSADSSVAGANLAAEMANYSSLIGMLRGSRFRRGFFAPGNFGSAANSLNHVGFIAEALDLDVPGHQGPRFVLVVPLTPAGLRNNRVDVEKVLSFMSTHRAGGDYRMVAASDQQGLADMYASSPFRVVAFLKAGQGVAENTFFALPEDVLDLPRTQPW
jgi:hypothetical protein